MVKKLLLTLGMIILFSSLAFSQSGTIKGTVTDQTGGAIEWAKVFLKKEGNIVNYTQTDAEGKYQLHGVSAGTFDLMIDASLIQSCPTTSTKKDVRINSGETVFENFKMDCGSTQLGGVEIVWEAPVFRADNTTSTTILDAGAVRKVAGNSIENALASSASVVAIDGSISSVRGQRSDGQKTMVDGMVMRGTAGVSMASIEQVELIQGGIPAEYGDGTSFTIITTKGISKDLHGSVELSGSLEGYNNFWAAASLTGPLLKSKKRDGLPRIGFLLTGDFSYDKDAYPAQGGTWRATDEAIDYLTKNPIRYSATNFGANYANGEYMTEENFKKQRVRDNASNWNYLIQGKLDFSLGKEHNVDLSIGGMYEFTRVQNWSLSTALYNAQNNSQTQNTTWRVNAKLNHRILVDTSSIFDNIMYNININYTRVNQWTRDANHKDNYFDYGHIGYYKTTKAHSYRQDSITVNGITYYDMNIFQGDYDSLVEFSPTPFGSDDESLISNPDLVYYVTNFTNNYSPSLIYDYFGEGYPYDKNLYQQFGALLNGDSPNNPYSLFSAPGSVYNGYARSEESQIGANASLSMTIKDHDIKLGYIFEKRTSRAFSIAPVGLWTLMRSSVNSHILELDTKNPYLIGEDTVMYNVNYDASAQTNFDRNLRTSLGLDPNGTDWIDVDNMSPDAFDIGMFSAEELFNGGSNLISYYGYDYTGTEKYNKKTDITDFFTNEENGEKTYRIGAYEPIYMAMYIQDKFSIQTLLFNIGLRIDRFDANQSVLADPYLFRAAQTVADVRGSFNNIPSNAQDDWVVYVNQLDKTLDAENSNIVAYRSGHTWYNAAGQEISDPTTVLGATGGPILKKALPENDANNKEVSKVDYDAFTDYEPQWSIMPRLSFSFPVSKKSLFYAHYNIITSRPTNLRLDPISYLWIEKLGTNANNTISNPNLKPQRSIDYEIGFRQAIGENSAISLAAYYSEKRDQIQAYRYSGAYPTTYYSYDNIDFGTVQGFTLSYDLRRTKNVTLRASYTLQFAKGTGSSETSGLSIIANGQPNLRTLTNLSFDQRHRLSANIDYRFGAGVDYNGPTIKKEKNGKLKETPVFENMGININFSAGSGLPYTRSSKPYSTYVSGTKSQLSGTINGSNKPWIYQCDVRIDKSFILNMKKDEKGVATKQAFLNVYLEVMNIFNFKNVIYVYEYTGNADDDGYLSSSEYQQQINSQVNVASYSNYYRMRMTDPYNYTMPTRVRLGVQFTF